MRLSKEVLNVIRANLLLFAETIAYLRQCMLNHVHSYSNVTSANFGVPVLAL